MSLWMFGPGALTAISRFSCSGGGIFVGGRDAASEEWHLQFLVAIAILSGIYNPSYHLQVFVSSAILAGIYNFLVAFIMFGNNILLTPLAIAFSITRSISLSNCFKKR